MQAVQELAAPVVTPGRPRLLDCPVCGGAITLRAVGHSVSVVCAQCGTLLDVAREEVKILKKAMKFQGRQLIPLGSRGTLDGIEWEAVGYIERSSVVGMGERYAWQETLLFNPRHGFRFLAMAQGHWSLYRVIKSGMAPPAGHKFLRFYTGRARVDYALGEFYWRVKEGDEVQVSDAISPPYVLSTEKDSQEVNISLGRYLPPDEVATAFGLDLAKLPRPIGVAPNQPSPFALRLPSVLRTVFAALLVATVIQFAQAMSADKRQVHAEHFDVPTHLTDRTRVSQPFVLAGGLANVCLESQAVLRNNWAELNATLVEETTQTRHNLLLGMEYYFGVDGGEAWSEGSDHASGCFSSVPAGQYRLILEPDGGVLRTDLFGKQTFGIQVVRDAPIWSNWLALLLALLPYPFYLWLRHHGFEYARWSDSEFMPENYANLKNLLSDDE